MTQPPNDWLSPLPDEIKAFVTRLLALPDAPFQVARYAQALLQASPSQAPIAESLAIQARRMAANDARVRHATEWIFRKRVPRWHFSLLHDATRNAAYHEALRHHVQPGMTVLEIGAGSGILAMLAARCGAAHVYACEMEPLLAAAARENIARNGLASRVTIIEKNSLQTEIGPDLPQRADLLVSEIVDNDLLGEGVLPVMEDAWKRLLHPAAIVLPSHAELHGALVSGMPWTRNFRAPRWDGLDLSALELLAPAKAPLGDAAHTTLDDALSDDVPLLSFDFTRPETYSPEEKEIRVTARRDGRADALVHWLVLKFGSSPALTNRPSLSSVWCPFIHAFPQPLETQAGREIRLRLRHDLRSTIICPA